MKKIFALALALTMALSLASCGGGDKPAPAASNPATPPAASQPSDPGTSQQEPSDSTSSKTPDDNTPSGESDNASVAWPENEWTEIIPKAADTVIKIDENMSTGMGSAYAIYMDWTDDEAHSYGQKIAEIGAVPAAPEIIDDVFQMLYADPDSGRMVQITELGETEDDYVIVLYK